MIQTHGNSFIQSPILISNIKSLILIGNIKSPILIGNIKIQFLLAISKPNFYWQHQSPIPIGNIKNPIFIGTTLSKRKEPKIINAWQRKKYHVKMLLWQKRTMLIILWRNSLRAILRIMFSYYEPMKYMDIILHHDIHNIYLLHSW